MSEEATAFFPPESGEMAALTKPIAVLRFGPAELGKRVGIRFQVGHDDLDVLEWARVIGLSGRAYGLVHHHHAPKPGTAIVTRYDSTDPRADVLDVLEGLKLAKDDLVWTAPDALPAPATPATVKATRRVALRRSKYGSKLSVTVSPTLVTKMNRRRGRDASSLAKSLRGRMRGTQLEVTPSDVKRLLRYFATSSSTGRTQAKVSKKAAKKK